MTRRSSVKVHAYGANGRTLCEAYPARGASRVDRVDSRWSAVTCLRCRDRAEVAALLEYRTRE